MSADQYGTRLGLRGHRLPPHWQLWEGAGTAAAAAGGKGEAVVAEKPSYLGLLNAVSLAESRAHCYLSAWADVTANDDLRAVLRTVAAREGEHGMAFAKRIDELGFDLEPKDDPNFDDRM